MSPHVKFYNLKFKIVFICNALHFMITAVQNVVNSQTYILPPIWYNINHILYILALVLAHLGSSTALSEADSCAQTSRGISLAEAAVARASCGHLAAQLSISQRLRRNSACVRNRIGHEAARSVRAAAELTSCETAAAAGWSAQRCGRDEYPTQSRLGVRVAGRVVGADQWQCVARARRAERLTAPPRRRRRRSAGALCDGQRAPL